MGDNKFEKLQFSGHDSFACKQFWLKKGYDFTLSSGTFSSENAVVDLGVGKNMVGAIRYWSKAFDIIDEDDRGTPLGEAIFSQQGYDPYLEDKGSIWLMHYSIIKKNKASVYSLFFNEFRKERHDFTKNHLQMFLKRKCEETSLNYNENTIGSDINVLFKNYANIDTQGKHDVEDAFSNMFLDLNIFDRYTKKNIDGVIEDWYKAENKNRDDLPAELLLFAILDTYEGATSITFRQILVGFNSPGNIFLINADGLHKKILQITAKYKQLVFSETAGNQILQIKADINKWEVLNEYYR